MKYFKKEKFKKGFGILEVLVSAVIIITILMALVFVGKTALANSVYIQQRAQATFLAQEGIEHVRQIRDTNWIDGANTTQWNSLAWNGTPSVLTPITSNGNYILSINGGRYGLTASGVGETISINNTSYSRIINVAPIVADTILPDGPNAAIDAVNNALKITVTVSFDNVTGNKSISASEVITNWRPNY